MSKIAIIPARGDSKRIHKKNIKNFCGKPIIAYSIETAQKTRLFKRIIVSTDDKEIAEVAKHYGAEIPFKRPADLSDDHTGLRPVLRHAIKWIQNNGENVEYMCSIMATAPMLTAETLINAYRSMIEANAAGAIGVTTFPACIFRALKEDAYGRLEMVWPENFPKRSQDFPDVFHDAGQFAWFRVSDFPMDDNTLPSGIIPFRLSRIMAQDIDTPEDWVTAEHFFITFSCNMTKSTR